MKKTIKLTEQDLKKLVKRIIKESASGEEDLILAAEKLLIDLGYTEEELADLTELYDFKTILNNEYAKHGPIMNNKIDDMLFDIDNYYDDYTMSDYNTDDDQEEEY